MEAHLVMGPEVVVGGVHTKRLTTLTPTRTDLHSC